MDLPHSDIHNEHLRHLNFHIICLKACCLEIVLSSGDFEEENGHLQDLLLNIETVFQDVEQELSTVGVNITKITFEECYCVTVDTDGVISSILERLELLNPDIQQLCELISSKFSPRSVTGYPSHETVKANVKLLLRHIEYLVIHEFEEVAPLYKDLESTRKSLVFLRNFLGFTSKRTSKHIGNFTDLVNHAEFVVRNIACLLYLCPVYFNVNDPMGNDWIMQFSSELFNFSPEQAATREIYINALEGSKSSSLRDSNAAVDEFDYEFLESLKNSILELSETKFGFIACNRDHILSLHKEIRILTICFAMSDSSVSNRSWFGPKSPLELDHILHISNYFREHISAIIIDMGCLIYTLYNDEQNMDGSSNQLKMAVTALQDSIKTAQENARKEYQPYIPKSWLMKTKLRIADAKGIVLSLTRAWEKSNSYASEMRFMSYYLHRIRDDVFSAFQEELQSLIEAFSKLTEQNIKAADFRIIHADDIRSKAEYFFSSNWVDFWSKNLMLFLLIEDIKKINRKIEDLQCQIMQESKESDASVNVGVGGGIEDHEDNLDLICTQKVEIGAHGLKEAFLEVFLRCKGKKHTEHEKLRVLITSICSGSDGTGQDIQRLFADSNSQISPKKGCFLPINMDGLFCKSSRFISCFGEQAIIDDDEEALLKNLNALLQNIEILLKYNNELVDPMKEEHEAAQKILRFLRNFIGFTSKSSGELQKLKDLLIHSEVLVGKISFLLYLCLREYFIDSGTDGLQSQWSSFLDTAYQTEYVIDSFLAGDCHLNSVHKSSCFPTQVLVKESDLPKRNAVISSKQTETDEKSTSKLLIFEEEEKNIREKLTYGSEKLSIISIVGMGGIGKTTLADSVFEHSAVTHHFYVKARCTVSQVHDRRRLLLEILKQLNKQCSDNDDELDRKLYQSLKGRRYLIFMDDVWDLRPWEDLRASFPNESNGSRIIFTTRSHDIAAQTLTIDLVAGVLREKDSEEWKSVAESLMTILFKDPERRCQEVVELSYRNLPDDIKPCFLYYAAFPEDENVSTEALISLWIAEGFVLQEKDGESRRLEDVGNDILKKLISRSLVTVSRETPMGEVAATRVHDLLHEFAVSKAREENFMLRTDDQRRDPYRLCIYPENWVSFLKANPSGPRTRSLICCDAPSVINNILLNLSAFKLLRVLYIPNANSCHYHPEMFRLIHLRVFVIGGPSNTNISLIMAKIHKFRNLECFIMSTVHQSVNLLLDKICKMERLRTFCFGGYISFQYRSEKIWETSSLLRNLRTLYNLKASYEEDIEKILNLMPNLVVLEVVFYSPHEDSHQFPKLDFLNKLEFLKIMHKGESGFSARKIDEICFPQYLKTLVLSNFRLPWTEIWKLGNLEFLETLKLEDDAFEGPIWDMIDGQFPNLKYLNLFGLDIQEWNASGDHLCRLQGLLVSDCRKLEELPPCLAEIETLQRIKMVYCKDTAEISALIIKQEQDQIRDYQLVVDIIKDYRRCTR